MVRGVEWNGIQYKQEDFEYLNNILIDIKSYECKPVSENNFKAVYEQCYRFFSGFPVPILEMTDKMLVRARPNFNGELFTCEEDISYNSKHLERIKLGRFNRPNEPIFYGSLPTVGEHTSFLVTSMLETRKDVLDSDNTELSFDFTVGTWDISPFSVICLCFDDKHLNTNQRMKEYIDFFKTYIKERCSDKDSDFILSTLKYFSDLSSIKANDDSIYMLLTALFCALRMVYSSENVDINGIVYPSSITESKGLNVALTKKAVDSYLHLTQVVMHRIERWTDNRCQLDIYPITRIEPVIKKIFHFSNIGDKRSELGDMHVSNQ
ncbi:MAG: hypothetical protein JST10_14900 [Bacteroidetes bacterium]|nr:hypothetical protein [Bacteroidota bacterium]